MNRRNLVAGIVSLPGIGCATPLAAQRTANTPESDTSSGRCVFMEEREGAFILEGTGHLLTEPFHLNAGTYRIEVEVTVPESQSWMIDTQFYIQDDGSRSGSFTLTDGNKVPGYGSGAITARETGNYVVEVTYFDDNWKIVLSPI